MGKKLSARFPKHALSELSRVVPMPIWRLYVSHAVNKHKKKPKKKTELQLLMVITGHCVKLAASTAKLQDKRKTTAMERNVAGEQHSNETV